MTEEDGSSSSDVQWIFRGNLVVPIDNPFSGRNVPTTPREASEDDCVWLGPGLAMLLDHIVVVDRRGIISRIQPARQCSDDEIAALSEHPEYAVLDDHRDFLVPGFVDLHIHAPQFSYAGTATDRPLMGNAGWLESYTFPAERRLASDPGTARHVYRRVVETTLRNGTTTAVYYGSLHLEPCKVLVDTAMDLGQVRMRLFSR